MQKWAPVILRFGMGLVMLWFALQQLGSPTAWVGYLPEWTKNLPISQIDFIYINGWFELTFGALLIAGFYTRIVALLLSLHLLGIVFSVGYSPIGVRDFGLTIALFSIFLSGPSDWSLDKFFEKMAKNNTAI